MNHLDTNGMQEINDEALESVTGGTTELNHPLVGKIVKVDCRSIQYCAGGCGCLLYPSYYGKITSVVSLEDPVLLKGERCCCGNTFLVSTAWIIG